MYALIKVYRLELELYKVADISYEIQSNFLYRLIIQFNS